jgi:hypothetical protein
MTPRLTLEIGELTLFGIDPRGRFELAQGLSSELERLFSEQGVPQGLLSGGAELAPISLDGAPSLSPVEVGRSVARAIYAGWR